MSDQPEALRLADWIESEAPPTDEASCADVAAELRRLHAVNMELLEALDKIAINTHDDTAERVARAALEQPEQEPLYTRPPSREWVGLTDEEIEAARAMLQETLRAALEQPEQDTDCHAQGICQRSGYGIGRPEQEPVAYVDLADGSVIWKRARLPGGSLLYTHPPRREWVGLTDTENLPGEDSHCLTEDPDAMCAACNCWKKTREFCG